MGAASSVAKLPADAKDLIEFVGYFAPLAEQTPAAKKARQMAWMGLDPNNNGLVSLAEFDGWVQNVLIGGSSLKDKALGEEEGKRLWRAFRKSYIRAFNDAKDIGEKKDNKGGKTNTDDYVTKGEFRLLAAYACIYATMFDAFAKIDGGSDGQTADDDRRIDLDELKASYASVSSYPLVALQSDGDVEAIFKAMDLDGKGKVLLIEFCKYCEAAEQEQGTDIGKMLAVGDDDEMRTVEAAKAEATAES